MNKKNWLDYLFYNIGNQQYDFRLCGLKRLDEDEVISTKWRKYTELCFPLDIDETWKLENINTREILPCEVVIDLEDKNKIKKVVEKLERDKLLFYVFSTGSRGYHIHIFFVEKLINEEKLKIIKRYGGDEQKAHQGTTIALEYAKHWKSGKIKEEIKWK